MENKYYTPDILEFHIGFRYEKNNHKEPQWFKRTCDGYDMGSVHTMFNRDVFKDKDGNKRYPVEESLRVKYLDKADIEELGWKEDVNEDDSSSYNLGNYKLIYFSSDEVIEITNELGDTHFYRVKNYNQLKSLMQMLEI